MARVCVRGTRATLHFTGRPCRAPASTPTPRIQRGCWPKPGRQCELALTAPLAVPTAVVDLICAALRGENSAWPWPEDFEASANFHRHADMHGVQALLHSLPAPSQWPQSVLQELRTRAVQLAMWELRHQQVLGQTLAALDAIGVQPILIKGTALAYSIYADPALRTRGDTDLIIPIDAKGRVHEALTSLGFERSLAVSGEFVSYQASYTRVAPDGAGHTLDLHWKINNSELLSRLFTYEELRRDAEPLPQLCPHALAASRVHALLLACMHRSTHKQNPYYVDGEPHHDANRLIWLYDIHLLAGRLEAGEWEEFVRLAGEKGLRSVCLEGMRQAQRCFHSAFPEDVLAGLAQAGAEEPPARYLAGGRLRQQWMDWRALGSWRKQLRFAREVVFPPADYVRAKFGQPQGWLPWLYLRRAADGAARRLGRVDRGS